jgi:multicomponent Na+:H+ antiporter subunit F
MIETATTACLVLLGIAILLILIRIIRGPTLADRILGLDTLTLLGVGVVGVFSVRTGVLAYVDVAVALAFVSFVSTAALSRYLQTRSDK